MRAQSPAESRHARRRAATRARLLDAAYAVFSTRGYSGATVDDIAVAAAVSKGAVYFHFASKEDIFVAVLLARISREERSLREAVEQRGERSPADVLKHFLMFIEFGERDPSWPPLMVEFWSQAARSERVREAVASVNQFRRRALFAALGAATDAGILHPTVRLDHCTDVLLTLGDGCIAQAGSGQPSPSTAMLAGTLRSLLGIPAPPSPLRSRPRQPARGSASSA